MNIFPFCIQFIDLVRKRCVKTGAYIHCCIRELPRKGRGRHEMNASSLFACPTPSAWTKCTKYGEARAAEKNVLLTGYVSAILFGRESSFPKAKVEEKQKESPEKMSFSKEQKNEKNVPKFFFGGENLKKDVSRFFFRNESEPYGKKTKKGDSDSLVICLALFVSATYLLLWRRCYASLASCNRTEHVKAHKNPLGSFPVPWYLRISPGRSSLRGPEKSGLCIF